MKVCFYKRAIAIWKISYLQMFGDPQNDTLCMLLNPEPEPLCPFRGPENYKIIQYLSEGFFMFLFDAYMNCFFFFYLPEFW